jgi:predicted DsbA family dithiol-disulfide isomerase
VFYYQNMKEQKQSEHSHPFGQELAQVREIAEEYGVDERLHAVDEETQHMEAHGLFKFTAQDYLTEIQCFLADRFTDVQQPQPVALWI